MIIIYVIVGGMSVGVGTFCSVWAANIFLSKQQSKPHIKPDNEIERILESRERQLEQLVAIRAAIENISAAIESR